MSEIDEIRRPLRRTWFRCSVCQREAFPANKSLVCAMCIEDKAEAAEREVESLRRRVRAIRNWHDVESVKHWMTKEARDE